eukprot:TRINITY_DN9875_c0_g1_i1.p2 TRINITY_DN9875_c0_g1~~TRINITY_DN9875_c0_g1_i1.p2  ORF type:complete len:105 (-),score=15.12 TRINITY_DN9875_c0_g1_i1:40-330(-)
MPIMRAFRRWVAAGDEASSAKADAHLRDVDMLRVWTSELEGGEMSRIQPSTWLGQSVGTLQDDLSSSRWSPRKVECKPGNEVLLCIAYEELQMKVP